MKEKISQALQKGSEYFESYSLRERALASITILTILFISWDTWLMTPEVMKQEQVLTDMQNLNQKIEGIATQLTAADTQPAHHQLIQKKQRIDEIERILKQLRQQQNSLTGEFIAPQKMVSVLRDLLETQSSLVLTQLRSLGTHPLFPDNTVAIEKEIKNEVAPEKTYNIYKHGVQIIFEGDFFSTLHYLQALEDMPWRFYWDTVNYQVLEFPQARVTITIHTLSLDERWIGV
ncbi:MAG: hypothetical protein GXP14_05010 [Gammaproteobacteria bacterium]|nr:hypothetical protein [Gammaproteobacteria bacterium]